MLRKNFHQSASTHLGGWTVEPIEPAAKKKPAKKKAAKKRKAGDSEAEKRSTKKVKGAGKK